MTRTARYLLAALLALPLAVAGAPPAQAYWSSTCESGGTITFSPPLGSLPTTGTWVMDGDNFCAGAIWGTGGVFPATDSWHGTGSGTYTGNCVEATMSDGYAMNLTLNGSVLAGYMTAPWREIRVGALTGVSGQCPLGPMSVARYNVVAVASSYVP